jgi:glycosyltransferase involved in cell wall biosynthesis
MSVYNAERYLGDAVQSVLSQSFRDFEFIIINDGSTDQSRNILSRFDDSRVQIVDNSQNKGLIFSLNLGFSLARGKYIARMDADDVCLPNRLEAQFQFMELNQALGLCGSDYINFSESFSKNCSTLKGADILKSWLLFSSPLCHPSVMIRRSAFPIEGYDINFPHVEDYELWTRIAMNHTLDNCDSFLLKYRDHPNQVSKEKRNQQIQSSCLIQKNYLKRLGFLFSEEELLIHSLASSGEKINHLSGLIKISEWLNNLLIQNEKIKALDVCSLQYCVGRIFYDVCGNTSLGRIAFKFWRRSPLRRYYGSDLKSSFRQRIKCAVRKFRS